MTDNVIDLDVLEKEATEKAEELRQRMIEKEHAREVFRAKYPMRGLKGGDMFTFLAILGKLDIKDQFIKMYSENLQKTAEARRQFLLNDHEDKAPTKAEELQAQLAKIDKDLNTEQQGIEMIGTLLEKVTMNISSIQSEINGLIASLINKSVVEVVDIPLADYMAIIVEIFKGEDFKTFMKSATSLLA